MRSTRLFPLVLMLALALLTFYLERAVREEEPHTPLRRHDPDYMVSNFLTTTYNRDGVAEARAWDTWDRCREGSPGK